MPAGTYELRGWTSVDVACPYPADSDGYESASVSVAPRASSATLEVKGNQAELSAALENTDPGQFLCVALDQPGTANDRSAAATAFSDLDFVESSFTLLVTIDDSKSAAATDADVPSGDYTATLWATQDNTCPAAIAGRDQSATATVGPHITALTLSQDDDADTVTGTITLDDSQAAGTPDYNTLPYRLCFELTGPSTRSGGAADSPLANSRRFDNAAITINNASRQFSYTFSNDLAATGRGDYTVKAWTAHNTRQTCQQGLNSYARTSTATLSFGRPTVESLSFTHPGSGLTITATGTLSAVPDGISYTEMTDDYICYEIKYPGSATWESLSSTTISGAGFIDLSAGQFQRALDRNILRTDQLPLGEYQLRAWTTASSSCPASASPTVATATIGNLEATTASLTINQKTPQVTVTLTEQHVASSYSTLSYYLCVTLQPPAGTAVGGIPEPFADLTFSQATRQTTYALTDLDAVPSGNYTATVWPTTQNSCATEPSHKKTASRFIGPHVETLTFTSDFTAQTLTAAITFDDSVAGERYSTLPYKLCYELTNPDNTKTTGAANFNSLTISDTRQTTYTLRNITAAGSYTFKAWTASTIPNQTCTNGDRGASHTKTTTTTHGEPSETPEPGEAPELDTFSLIVHGGTRHSFASFTDLPEGTSYSDFNLYLCTSGKYADATVYDEDGQTQTIQGTWGDTTGTIPFSSLDGYATNAAGEIILGTTSVSRGGVHQMRAWTSEDSECPFDPEPSYLQAENTAPPVPFVDSRRGISYFPVTPIYSNPDELTGLTGFNVLLDNSHIPANYSELPYKVCYWAVWVGPGDFRITGSKPFSDFTFTRDDTYAPGEMQLILSIADIQPYTGTGTYNINVWTAHSSLACDAYDRSWSANIAVVVN